MPVSLTTFFNVVARDAVSLTAQVGIKLGRTPPFMILHQTSKQISFSFLK